MGVAAEALKYDYDVIDTPTETPTSDRNKTEQFLSEYLHGKTPALIKAR